MNRKMKMKKAIFGQLGIFFCLSTVILLMAGCGGKYSESSESERAVSGPAVSGQAVSDSDGTSRYTYCSDRNLYYVRKPYSDEAKLVERNLESGAEREIPAIFSNLIICVTTCRTIMIIGEIEKILLML